MGWRRLILLLDRGGTKSFRYYAVDLEGQRSNITTVRLIVRSGAPPTNEPPTTKRDPPFHAPADAITTLPSAVKNDTDPVKQRLRFAIFKSDIRGYAYDVVNGRLRMLSRLLVGGKTFTFGYFAIDPGGRRGITVITG